MDNDVDILVPIPTKANPKTDGFPGRIILEVIGGIFVVIGALVTGYFILKAKPPIPVPVPVPLTLPPAITEDIKDEPNFLGRQGAGEVLRIFTPEATLQEQGGATYRGEQAIVDRYRLLGQKTRMYDHVDIQPVIVTPTFVIATSGTEARNSLHDRFSQPSTYEVWLFRNTADGWRIDRFTNQILYKDLPGVIAETKEYCK